MPSAGKASKATPSWISGAMCTAASSEPSLKATASIMQSGRKKASPPIMMATFGAWREGRQAGRRSKQGGHRAQISCSAAAPALKRKARTSSGA